MTAISEEVDSSTIEKTRGNACGGRRLGLLGVSGARVRGGALRNDEGVKHPKQGQLGGRSIPFLTNGKLEFFWSLDTRLTLESFSSK